MQATANVRPPRVYELVIRIQVVDLEDTPPSELMDRAKSAVQGIVTTLTTQYLPYGLGATSRNNIAAVVREVSLADA